jgi:hypothetical protein
MSDEVYYLVKVKEHIEGEKGKVKIYTREKLLKAVSFTDVEVKITKLYEGVSFEWSIASAQVSKIDEVIL